MSSLQPSPVDKQHGTLLVLLFFAACALGSAVLIWAPSLGVEFFGAAVVAFVSVKRPEFILAAGVAATLSSSELGPIVSFGSAALLAGGMVASLEFVANRRAVPAFALVLVSTLAWLGLRLVVESNFELSRALLSCLGAVVLGISCLARERDWVPAFAWVGVAYVAATIAFGTLDASGVRFEGIAGNPNRMVFALLLFVPPMVGYIRYGFHPLRFTLMAGGLAFSISAIFRSGSDQGIAGLIALALVAAIFATRRTSSAWVAIGAVIASITAVTLIARSGGLGQLSTDTLTLSGRTDIFRAAWAQFSNAPWTGTGSLRIYGELIVDRSAHNSFLGIAVASGVLGAALWALVLLRATFNSVAGVRGGVIAASIGIVVVISQLVQAIELLPATWAALTLIGARKVEL